MPKKMEARSGSISGVYAFPRAAILRLGSREDLAMMRFLLQLEWGQTLV